MKVALSEGVYNHFKQSFEHGWGRAGVLFFFYSSYFGVGKFSFWQWHTFQRAVSSPEKPWSKIWLEKLGTLHCLGKIEHHLDPWSVAQIVNEMKLVMTNNLKLELLGLTLGRFHPSILGADVCSCQSTTAESKWLRWTSQYSMCIDVYCMFIVCF
jgi:hypothetical protein